MTKKLKSSLILSLFFLFGLMAALCAGAFSPALTPAKADETYYILSFLDSNYETSLMAYTRTGDSVFTEEDYNALTPTAVPGKVFAGWSVSSDNSKYSGVSLIGKTFLEIYNEQNAPSGYTVNFYPFFCEEDISFRVDPISESDYKQAFNITLKYNQEITQDIIDNVFGVQGYSIEVCYASGNPALGRIPVELRYTHEVSKFDVMYKSIPEYTITFMQDGAVKFTATAEKGKTLDLGGAGITSIMTKDGYTLKGYATAENGEIVYEANAVITPESDLTLYAVYEETKTPGDDSGNIGDKVNDVSNKISEWLKSKTGIALSSSGVIVLAVVLVLILFKRK